MQRDPAALLFDAQIAIERVQRFTASKGFDDYKANDFLRSAVERQLMVIGEALWQLRKSAPETADRLREIDRIIAFRHVLVHGYASIDDRVVFAIIEGKLGQLADDIRAHLEAHDEGDP
jgi:uncharacterized protein with HEPN domain